MKEYNFKVLFDTEQIITDLKQLVQNDYNTTKLNFTFDKEGRVLFKMLYPDGTQYVAEIQNNELIFGKGVLNQEGTYEYEISLYSEDGRLTDYAVRSFEVRSELVDTDELLEPDDRVPILDNLINEVETIKQDVADGKYNGKDGEKGDKGDAGSIKFIIANEPPSENIDESAIYMIPSNDPQAENTYQEYIYVNGTWESLGSASVNVDLIDYVKNTDYATSTTFGVVKVNTNYGLGHNESAGLYNVQANETIIDRKTDMYRPITAKMLDYAIKSGMTTNALEWTEEEKQSARDLIGVDDAIANSGGGDSPIIEAKLQNLTITNTKNSYSLSDTDKAIISEAITKAYANGDGYPLIFLKTKGMFSFFVRSVTQLTTKPTSWYLEGFTETLIHSGQVSWGMTFINAGISILGSWEGDIFTCTSCSISLDRPQYLSKTNTRSYTPTDTYHPATKQYVDNAISTLKAELGGGAE